jgi:hypothetical protein
MAITGREAHVELLAHGVNVPGRQEDLSTAARVEAVCAAVRSRDVDALIANIGGGNQKVIDTTVTGTLSLLHSLQLRADIANVTPADFLVEATP